MEFSPEQHPHRRYNPLLDEWVLVSPHRTQRPWQGAQEKVADDRPAYDPGCYLCPGNARAGGIQNPPYEGTFVFDNDFAAVYPDVPDSPAGPDPLYRLESVSGTCRVICFSPRHDLTLPQMDLPSIRGVIDVWASESDLLGERFRWVQVFENKGAAMGCSNPHPHGQIWATDTVPSLVDREDQAQRNWRATNGKSMLVEVVDREAQAGTRVVEANDHWLAWVPFWAVWPFELMIAPRQPTLRLSNLDGPRRDALADLLQKVLCRYDNLFETSFPYSFGWHQAPYLSGDVDHWHLHAHLYPPLLRSATVRKFMVGYEMLAEPQRDLTPEQAADRLRACSTVHYTLQNDPG